MSLTRFCLQIHQSVLWFEIFSTRHKSCFGGVIEWSIQHTVLGLESININYALLYHSCMHNCSNISLLEKRSALSSLMWPWPVKMVDAHKVVLTPYNPFYKVLKGLATQWKAKTTFTFTHSLTCKRIIRRLMKKWKIENDWRLLSLPRIIFGICWKIIKEMLFKN